MKLLVLTQDYPSEKNLYNSAYVHSRNVAYLRFGIEVNVLNFATKQSYEFESIKVYPENDIKDFSSYDLILSHAPNLKNHCRFLKKLKTKKVIFFFHGHEVLHIYLEYPKTYGWNKPSFLGVIFWLLYDALKLVVMRKFLRNFAKKNHVGSIFVSDWMRERFASNLKIEPSELGPYAIIPNAVNEVFVTKSYCLESDILADCVTIRPLDASKYAVDLVILLAKNNPNLSFHIYGRGKMFDYCELPKNVVWYDKFLSHSELPGLLNKYKMAIMPTRYDSQGVMVCEMATYGIPLVTSDLKICREMLDDFSNVKFLADKEFSNKLEFNVPNQKVEKNQKFVSENVIVKEIDFMKRILNSC